MLKVKLSTKKLFGSYAGADTSTTLSTAVGGVWGCSSWLVWRLANSNVGGTTYLRQLRRLRICWLLVIANAALAAARTRNNGDQWAWGGVATNSGKEINKLY